MLDEKIPPPNATSYHISAQVCLCLCGAAWKTYACRTGACVWYPRVRGICVVHFMFITLVPPYVAPMYCYVTNLIVYHQYITVCLYILVCYSHTCILVCYSNALVFYTHVFVCTCMLPVCYSCYSSATRMYTYVLVCYSYVVVWCFSLDQPQHQGQREHPHEQAIWLCTCIVIHALYISSSFNPLQNSNVK